MLVIDKTGTLTVGKPTVNKIISESHFNVNEILFFAASLENNSEHHLANAIVPAAKDRNIQLKSPTEFIAEIGKGIRGVIDQKQVALGNVNLLELLNLQSGSLTEKADALRGDGATVMYVVIENQVAGLISVSDPIIPTTLAALKALREQGIRIMMLTGDNHITANAVANKLGIDSVIAEVLPQQKNETAAMSLSSVSVIGNALRLKRISFS
jgi:Cu+-exporting ATPase